MSNGLIKHMVTRRGLGYFSRPVPTSFSSPFHLSQSIINKSNLLNPTILSARAFQTSKNFLTSTEKEFNLSDVSEIRTFEFHGVDPLICKNLKSGFGITHATPAQTILIDSWNEGREIILNETTGSGKTFAMTVMLLSQALSNSRSQTKSLLIVPNRELALQVSNWCHRLLKDVPNEDSENYVQVVYRDSGLNSQQEELLFRKKPNLLIGTPTRLLELFKRNLIDVKDIQFLVLDEIDHLLRLPTKNAPLNRVKNRELHPKPTTTILERIFQYTRPQLAVMSATLNRSIRFYFRQMEWMTRPIYIDGTQGDHAKPPSTLEHMCVVVGKDSVFNLPFDSKPTVQSDNNSEENIDEMYNSSDEVINRTISENDAEESRPDQGFRDKEQERLDDDDERLFECVGVAAHSDQVKLGLLFVPNKVVIAPVLVTLQKMGIDAHSMSDYFHSVKSKSHDSLPDQQAETPRLLVASYFNARGIDIPEATHIYIVGFPGSPRDYLHVAGRAGRLTGSKSSSHSNSLLNEEGNSEVNFSPTSGRVVTFLPIGAHRPARMCHLYRFISVTPVPYPHIE